MKKLSIPDEKTAQALFDALWDARYRRSRKPALIPDGPFSMVSNFR